MPHSSRRTFLKNTVVAGALFPFVNKNIFRMEGDQPPGLSIHIFSKHLQFLNYQDMAEAAATMGFDGVDLTVRPNGHVLPERVNTDLPKAVAAMRKAGLKPLLMTTSVDDAGNPVDKNVLQTAAGLGFRTYRMNWYPYPEDKTMPEAITAYTQKVKELGQLNKELGLTGCYQNHSGLLVGASLWELWQICQDADHDHMGVQYDIRHAVVEGGLSWRNGLRLVQSRIRSLTIKDFKWEQQNGVWKVKDTPIGEGIVDFKTYFKLLKQYQIQVPVSLHIEYPAGGAEHGATKLTIDKQQVFKAMKQDLQRVRELWQQA